MFLSKGDIKIFTMNKRYEDRKELNKINAEPRIFREIFLGKRFRDFRLLLVITSLITLLTWIKNSISISCQLIFLQNIFLVFIYTTMILSRLNIIVFKQRIKKGVIVGGGVGAIYATVLFLIEEIHYYFMGGREDIATTLGKPVPPVNFYSIRGELYTALWFWLFLIILSAIVGFLAGVIPFRRRLEIDISK